MADVTTDAPAAPADAASAAAPTANAPASQPAAPATPPADASATPPADGQQTATQPSTDANAKPGEKPADAPAVPEKYDFQLPDGVQLEAAALEELSGMAKELGLTQEQAQKVANLGAKQAQAFAAQLTERQQAATAEWATQTSADKELAGPQGQALEENLSFAKKAIDTFATPEFKKLLNESGLGNHPEMVRVFVRAGKAISEDGRLVSGSAGQKVRESTPIENRIYPNQK
jgi:hypothetical protein